MVSHRSFPASIVPHRTFPLSTQAPIYRPAVQFSIASRIPSAPPSFLDAPAAVAPEAPASFLAKARAARLIASDLLADERLETISDYARALVANKKSLTGIETGLRLDLEWVEKAATNLGAIVENQVLEMCPSSAREISLDVSVAKLTALLREKHVVAAASDTRASVEACVGALQNMQNGISPTVDRKASPFYQRFLSSAQHFYRFQKPGSAGSADAPLTGKEAIAESLRCYKSVFAAGGEVTLLALEKIRPFRWLLTDAEFQEAKRGVGLSVHCLYTVTTIRKR